MTSDQIMWSYVGDAGMALITTGLLLYVLSSFLPKLGIHLRWTLNKRKALAAIGLGELAIAINFVAEGNHLGAAFAFLCTAVAVWLWREEGKDDDDDKRRRRVLKEYGEKSRAKLKEMADRVKQSPGLRPVPMPV